MYLWNHKKWTSFCILIHIFYFKDNVSHARVLFFVYAAQFLRLCPEVICPIIALSNRAEHLLIYRIQSHTYPKRRKFSLKQAGQKSVKEDLPEQRKAPKRAVECQLKVQTHIWENPPRPPHNFISGCSAVGSAPALGPHSQTFEPHTPDQTLPNRAKEHQTSAKSSGLSLPFFSISCNPKCGNIPKTPTT